MFEWTVVVDDVLDDEVRLVEAACSAGITATDIRPGPDRASVILNWEHPGPMPPRQEFGAHSPPVTRTTIQSWCGPSSMAIAVEPFTGRWVGEEARNHRIIRPVT